MLRNSTAIKQKTQGDRTFFKLPATLVLGDRIKDVFKVPIAPEINLSIKTFQEIWYEEKNQVGYLHFVFYNGAMSTEQCQRLPEAYLFVRSQQTKAIVLIGGCGIYFRLPKYDCIRTAVSNCDRILALLI